jgi:hypothetical protein
MSDTCTLSLRVSNPDADLERFCRSLGLTPERAWRTGERRATPSGRVLPGVYPHSYCAVDFGAASPTALPQKIEKTVAKLKRKRRSVAEITQTGGNVSLYVGWFSDGNTGQMFGWQLLQQLAELRISVEFDFYGHGADRSGARETLAAAGRDPSPETR